MAVGAECYTNDEGGMIPEGQDLLPGLRLPELDRPVVARRGDPPAVGAECDARDRSGVPHQLEHDTATGRVDDLNVVRCLGLVDLRDPPTVRAGDFQVG